MIAFFAAAAAVFSIVILHFIIIKTTLYNNNKKDIIIMYISIFVWARVCTTTSPESGPVDKLKNIKSCQNENGCQGAINNTSAFCLVDCASYTFPTKNRRCGGGL